MSSTYSVLCLSHDPAIIARDDISNVDEALAQADKGFEQHLKCDLVVAQYSGGIIRLACPGMSGLPVLSETERRQRPHHSGWHRDTVWIEADFLRLAADFLRLSAAVAHGTDKDNRSPAVDNALRHRMRGCWTVERLYKLREILDVADA